MPKPLPESLQAFLEALAVDAGLRDRLAAASDAKAVVAIATAAGFPVALDHLSALGEGLTDEELEAVDGGGAGIPCIRMESFAIFEHAPQVNWAKAMAGPRPYDWADPRA